MSNTKELIRDATELYNGIIRTAALQNQNQKKAKKRALNTVEKAFRDLLIDLRYNNISIEDIRKRLLSMFQEAAIKSQLGQISFSKINEISKKLASLSFKKLNKYSKNHTDMIRFLEYSIMKIKIENAFSI